MSSRICLEVVKRNKKKIRESVEEFLNRDGLVAEEIFVFKSRVTGTCKPYSDIDIYVQLDEKHRGLVALEGGLWADKRVLHKGVYNIPSPIIEIIQEGEHKGKEITLDITLGIDPVPPLPPKYIGKKWFMKLSNVI
ncbi:MAG: nucleotidyltransferase domain-containing protein [Candidatus Bathyarchaeum sp.]|nr:MAG: nucleotidyltransferase domain-containing protein [Candidatus Bathyarchaeum sp.]